jgi:hypothetical protein
VCVAPGEELFAVGVESGEDGTDQGQGGDGGFEDVMMLTGLSGFWLAAACAKWSQA